MSINQKLKLYIAFQKAGESLEIKSYDARPAPDAPAIPTELHHVIATDAPIEFSAKGYFLKGGDLERHITQSSMIGASLSKDSLIEKVEEFLGKSAQKNEAALQAFRIA